MFKCEKCEKSFNTKQGLCSHIGWHNKPNRDSNFINYNKKRINCEVKSSNQFIKAKEKGEIKIVSEETRKKISDKGKGRITSQETKDKISKSMKLAVSKYPDSYSNKNVCGRVKSYEYNGNTLLGSWELIVAKWLDFYSIKWTNKLKGIPYEWNNSIHFYFPDFYLFDYGLYIEVKGFQRNRDVDKWNSVDNLIVFKLNEINLIKNNKLDISILSDFKKTLYGYSEEKMKSCNNLDEIIKEKYFCINCGKEFLDKRNKYCSTDCYNKTKSKIPNVDELINKFKELKTFTHVGKYYDVSGNSVKKWCKKYNIFEYIKSL